MLGHVCHLDSDVALSPLFRTIPQAIAFHNQVSTSSAYVAIINFRHTRLMNPHTGKLQGGVSKPGKQLRGQSVGRGR